MHSLFLFLALLGTNPHSAFQILMPILTGSFPAAGGGTFAHVQHASSTTCASGSTSCAVTVASTGSGHLLVCSAIIYSATASIKISSCSGAGTWALCATSSCAISLACCAANIEADMAYNLNSTSGVTSITVNVSSAPTTSAWTAIVGEWSYTGASMSFDTAGTRTNTNCASCATPVLTLTGTKDVIIQGGIGGNALTAISGSYTDPAYFPGGVGFAGWVNANSGAAVNWSQTISAIAMDALAIKGN